MKRMMVFVGMVIVLALIYIRYFVPSKILSPVGNSGIVIEKKLDKYSYPALQKSTYLGREIIIDKILKDGDKFTSYLFYFYVYDKRISGLMNVPKKSGNYPAIVMIRGYVDKSIYEPGVGTSHGGELMAQNDFITLAPDFLGYGYSDKDSTDDIENRLMTYPTVLELISSIKNLNTALKNKGLSVQFDNSHLGIWGHSNGGQIALSIMEMPGKNYPTVLWAPVSKPFPYSILYYTDDSDDHGKALRKLVADFEKDYDSEKYSLTNYLGWIKAPLQIHQGGSDEAVPQAWSDTLVNTLKENKNDVEYFTYPGEDHNFSKGNWTLVMDRTMAFYKKQFSSN